MKFIFRRIVTLCLIIAVAMIVFDGFTTQFDSNHIMGLIACGALFLFMFCAKIVRKIIFAPINFIRRALFGF